ncbi:MAG: hypothetical protein CMJ18_03395 [Phycisphaeraceae bacterium]|nr:hypothetical protein [Phycisphaeraceae bacterium]
MNDPATNLPMGVALPALDFPHFPDRLHAFVFRNWHAVEPRRLADVCGATEAHVDAMARSMGLGEAMPFAVEHRPRSYITILRRNWHLLPYAQLLRLLDMSAAQMSRSLDEDDFLFHKLGLLKPECPPLRYEAPTTAARARAEQIRRIVEPLIARTRDMVPRFSFVDRLARPTRPPASAGVYRPSDPLRFIYAYSTQFGDPLMTPDLDPYPDGMLERLAERGVNGVWLHVLLREAAPGGDAFPEFGEGAETRLASLAALVERAGRYGIGIYLYLNEPRAMPEAFFENRPEIRGVPVRDGYALCTSTKPVRQWIAGAIGHLFRAVPDLAGLFTITASENPTHCASHNKHDQCPRCGPRGATTVIAELNNLVAEAARSVKPDARILAYDWGWAGHGNATDVVAAHRPPIELMSVSEWATPTRTGGVASDVGEYAISVVGPGPRAQRHWRAAQRGGLGVVAKVQVNNTWELSSVPYLPVMDLIAEHCRNLGEAGVENLMLSWSLGGFPSPNLLLADHLCRRSAPPAEEVLDELARQMFGDGAAHARRAWTRFSGAFRQFPFHVDVVYFSPVQIGPANLLFADPTGYRATMVGIPYDDVERWRGPYPPQILAQQLEKVADGWDQGLEELAQAANEAPEDANGASEQVAFAEAAALIFRSSARQVRIILARDEITSARDDARRRIQERLDDLLEAESDAALRMLEISCNHDCIGFEASNHYFFLPIDLVEKVVCCAHLRERYSSH